MTMGTFHLGEKALSVSGCMTILDSRSEPGAVGVCGGRHANPASLELAQQVGRAIADMGRVLVSGDARGVDEAAQFGALSNEGDVVLVLPQGIGGWKPRYSYRPFLNDSNYAAVSEFGQDAGWAVWRAMKRNGTIIDLAEAMVVVHAGTTGGTWEAGKQCLRRNRPLFVAYGQGAESEGSALLIEKGGRPFETIEEMRDLLAKAMEEGPVPRHSVHQGQLPIT